MIEQFKDYNKKEKLFSSKDNILLAVSGGIDSMTMLDIFMRCGFNFSVAHCNFQLRDSESDCDQEFVEGFARENRIELYINAFDTKNYAAKNKISIQMAARELRYTWFKKIADEYKFTKIATAHNLNDIVETFFINLTRGTGIKGLTGINIKQGNIIRPLLFAKRTDIKAYALENGVSYREDSSNAETKYLRNAIRHKIIPVFEELNPSFLNSVIHTTSILKSAEKSFEKEISSLNESLIESKDEYKSISISRLKNAKVSNPELFELLGPYGFSYDSIIKLLLAIDKQPGKAFYSQTHKLVIDRDCILIKELTEIECEEYTIPKDCTDILKPLTLNLKTAEIDTNFSILRNKSVGTFDADKLNFPLKLRRWQHGDVFYPFGMKGKKKLSDYFSDQKLSIIDKDKIWLLTSGDDIIWIVNHRTDNRYRVTKSTKRVLQIEVND